MLDSLAKWGSALLIALAVLTLGGGARVWRRRHSLGRGSFRSRRILVAVCLIVVAAALWIINSRLAPLTRSLGTLRAGTGQSAPNISFNSLADDARHRLAEFKGKTVLLDLWGTYCPPCISEMPQFDRLQEAYRDRGLVVILLSDEPPDKQRAFFQRHPTKLFCGYSGSFQWVEVGKFRPWTLVVDDEGVFRQYSFGASSFEQLETLIGPYVRGRGPNPR